MVKQRPHVCRLRSGQCGKMDSFHDKESRVSKMREENEQRTFYVIDQLHTLPNINYLAKVRNTDEIIEPGKEG